ncbi:hypothetical protein ACJX0J_025143, partial [Zea mays]
GLIIVKGKMKKKYLHPSGLVVHNMLVDNGSPIEIIFSRTFRQMQEKEQKKPIIEHNLNKLKKISQVGNEKCVLLDFYSGYHQIWTSFIMPNGTYCYLQINQIGRNVLTYKQDHWGLKYTYKLRRYYINFRVKNTSLEKMEYISLARQQHSAILGSDWNDHEKCVDELMKNNMIMQFLNHGTMNNIYVSFRSFIQKYEGFALFPQIARIFIIKNTFITISKPFARGNSRTIIPQWAASPNKNIETLFR